MAIKSTLIANVNGFLTALITFTKHRSSMLEVINELYPTKVPDSNTLETYTTKNGSLITYNIAFVKQGRSVRINGTYTNPSATTTLPNGTKVFDIDVNEFRGDTTGYLGINADYTPYQINIIGTLAPLQSRAFSITINSDL